MADDLSLYRERVARCWCDPRTESRELDSDLAEVFAEMLRAAEADATHAALEKAREALGDLYEWTRRMGAELCPPGPDTYGEGVRISKDTVAYMLDNCDEAIRALGDCLGVKR